MNGPGEYPGYGFPDPPYLIDLSAQNDPWSRTQPILLSAAEAGRLPLVVGWGPFGHSNRRDKIARFQECSDTLAFPWIEIRKNASYPVFAHASSDQQSPWSSIGARFDQSGQINAYFRWQNKIDDVSEYALSLWIAQNSDDGSSLKAPKGAVVDITLRRLQRFRISQTSAYDWALRRHGSVVGSGRIRPDAANLLTIRRATLTTGPTELFLKSAASETPTPSK